MARVLVVANETLGGRALAAKARELKDADPGLQIVICVPRTNPRFGNIIYDEAVYGAAQVRVDLARVGLREQMGIESVGEVGDPDPYTAAMDAVREWRPDRIVVSTKPATSSGWLKRDLIERIEDATGLPVDHVIVDIESEGLPYHETLVVANRTTSSPASHAPRCTATPGARCSATCTACPCACSWAARTSTRAATPRRA